ncbi:hypothetical protein [Cytobacillus gottheilii]|nr:hypothetical protein [Cytobacillus gottheilii]
MKKQGLLFAPVFYFYVKGKIAEQSLAEQGASAFYSPAAAPSPSRS